MEDRETLSRRVISDIITYTKYAKHLNELNRRETWIETVDRSAQMHIRKFPQLEKEIKQAFQLVYEKKVLPSMRSAQFAGKPVEISPNRLYNCSFLAIDSWQAFHEIMFLLLGGSGVGFSVQKQDVAMLPPIRKPTRTQRRILVQDSIIGWADTIKILMKSYFYGLSDPIFDFRDIREKGTPLKTAGGVAPGHEPLALCVQRIRTILDAKKENEQLTPIEAHDIVCIIADAVLAGGIRRSALLSLFSLNDKTMLTAKHGNWYDNHPWRSRANNSANLLRYLVKRKDFDKLWNDYILPFGYGEPAPLFSNNARWGTNPCQPGSALILTQEGIKKLININIGDVIWSGKKWTRVINKQCSGNKDVYKYGTNAGYFIGTTNHRILQKGIKVEVNTANEIDIAKGPETSAHISELSPDHIIDGLVIGDGYVHKASNNLVLLLIGNKDHDYFNSEIAPSIIKHRPGIGPFSYEITTSITSSELPHKPVISIPDRYFYGNQYEVCGFLRGLYTANGSIVDNRITLKSSSRLLIDQVQQMLSSIGICSYITTNKPSEVKFHNGKYICKESYDLNITTDREKFANHIGFIQNYKNQKLQELISSIKPTAHPKLSYNIVSKDFICNEPVYDITVEDTSHAYWSGGLHVGNCGEVSLNVGQFCNLTTINVAYCLSQLELEEAAEAAAFIGTLQASYTDFHYLRQIWRNITEKEALLGVSLTGIVSNWHNIQDLDFIDAAKVVADTNDKIASQIGINKAARLTCIKPEGTSSLALGAVTSGIHPAWSRYIARRLELNKSEPLYKYLAEQIPELVEDHHSEPDNRAYAVLPLSYPKTIKFRDEPTLDILERIKKFSNEWILPGHRDGHNRHNVSSTVTVKDNEWQDVINWMWDNRDIYSGITTLPYDGGKYKQAPFTEINKAKFDELMQYVSNIDLSKVQESNDTTNLNDQVACAGGACQI